MNCLSGVRERERRKICSLTSSARARFAALGPLLRHLLQQYLNNLKTVQRVSPFPEHAPRSPTAPSVRRSAAVAGRSPFQAAQSAARHQSPFAIDPVAAAPVEAAAATAAEAPVAPAAPVAAGASAATVAAIGAAVTMPVAASCARFRRLSAEPLAALDRL